MTTSTNFLGIPVEGDITKSYRSKAKQISLEEFQAVLRPVIEHPLVEAVRWQQYTPYFNDGDPCEFNIYDITIKLEGDEDFAEDNWGSHPKLTDSLYVPGGFVDEVTGRKEYFRDIEPEEPELIKLVEALNKAVCGPAYDILLDAFGDHAEVTVKKDKIEVESYDHD